MKFSFETSNSFAFEQTSYRTALWYASSSGREDICEILLNSGASVNINSPGGGSALWRASCSGFTNIVSCLLRAGADITLTNSDGRTALHVACSNGKIAVAELLLRHGADPYAEDLSGKLTLDYCQQALDRATLQDIYFAVRAAQANTTIAPADLPVAFRTPTAPPPTGGHQISIAELIAENHVLTEERDHARQHVVELMAQRDQLIIELYEARQAATNGQIAFPFHRYRPHALVAGIVPVQAAPGIHNVANTSPLFTYCRSLCTAGGAWLNGHPRGIAGFRLVGVDAVVHADETYTVYTGTQNRMNRLRQVGGDHFNFPTHTMTTAQLNVLSVLRDGVFQEKPPGASTRSVNTLYCFHGPRREHVQSVCINGMVAVRALDAGFFGSGCYSTLSIEYALRYAHGDFDDDGGPRASPDGRYPVIMFAATVGMAYPVTPGTAPGDYNEPAGNRFAGHSDFHGRPLKPGFDCHVICVSQAAGFQAVTREQCEYVELVIDQQAQMLPVAVLWFEQI